MNAWTTTRILVGIVMGTSFTSVVAAQQVRPQVVPGEFIVRFDQNVQVAAAAAAAGGAPDPATVSKRLDLHLLKLPAVAGLAGAGADAKRADQIARSLTKLPQVEIAVPNRLYYLADTVPTDPEVGNMWSLEKISAFDAWDYQRTSPNIVVGVIDTGIFLQHEDLAQRIWQNPDEVVGDKNGDGAPGIKDFDDDGDGLVDEDSNGRQPGEDGYDAAFKDDDDENGYIDDVAGWDFYNGDNDPSPDFVHVPIHPIFCGNNPATEPWLFLGKAFEAHGTHVAGLIGATANNNGTVGISWDVQIMPLKFLGGRCASGTLANALRAIEYAIDKNVPIINNSWGGPQDAILDEVINLSNAAGVLFVAAAGNEGSDNDATSTTPSTHAAPNVLSVAATDENDKLATFSNYGESSVDIGAPGVSIVSTIPVGTPDARASGYGRMQGTSMAAPIVSGAAALAMARYPNLTHLEIKQLILKSGDAASDLVGKTASEKRLNLKQLLEPQSLPLELRRILAGLTDSQRTKATDSLTPTDRARITLYPTSFNYNAANIAWTPAETEQGLNNTRLPRAWVVSLEKGIKLATLEKMVAPLNVKSIQLASRLTNTFEVVVESSLSMEDERRFIAGLNNVRSVSANKTYKAINDE